MKTGYGLQTVAATRLQLTPKIQKLVQEYPSVINIPVQWGEQDIYGHLNNVVYARYFENGRVAFLTDILGPKLSFGQFNDFINARSVGVVVKSLEINYKSAVTYPDVITLATRVPAETIQEDRFIHTFIAISHQQERIVADGQALMVAFNFKEGKKSELPSDLVDILRVLDLQNKIKSKL